MIQESGEEFEPECVDVCRAQHDQLLCTVTLTKNKGYSGNYDQWGGGPFISN